MFRTKPLVSSLPNSHLQSTGQPAPTAAVPVHADGLRALVAACIRNERAAQKAFYDQYSPAIYGVILRYTSDRYLSSELLNEAFFRVLTRLDQYRFDGAIEGWMRRIAMHTITDHFRKEQKHYDTKSLPESHEEDNTGMAVEGNGLAGLSYKELLAQVQKLPDTQRAVFNLFVFEDQAHKEIAALLGISEANSRWQLNDARRRLKQQIMTMNGGA